MRGIRLLVKKCFLKFSFVFIFFVFNLKVNCGKPPVEVGAMVLNTTHDGKNYWDEDHAETIYQCDAEYNLTTEGVLGCDDSTGRWEDAELACICE